MTLSWRDARAVFQLLGELRELGHDPTAWREHMLRRLCRLVGASVGAAAMIPLPFAYDPARYHDIIDLGWATPREREAWTGQCHDLPADADPCDDVLRGRRDDAFTVVRTDLVTDRSWSRAPYVNERCRAARIDDFVISHVTAPRFGLAQALMLYRPWAETRFGDRAVRLVDAFHRELGYQWRRTPAEPRLSRRQRQTLAALVAGDSEKQAADRLGVSAATLHDYVKALHRRFDVRSRAELLAAARRAPAPPRLG